MKNLSIQTAVIGLGRISWSFHLPQIMQHPGFELLAVVDPLAKRLKEAECKFHSLAGYFALPLCRYQIREK